MQIIDISNPSDPVQIGTNFDISTIVQNPTSIKVNGFYAYIAGYGASTPNQFGIINISNPESPSITGTNTSTLTAGTNSAIDIQGGYAYIGNSNVLSIINIYDVASITNASIISSITLTMANIINWIRVKDNNVFVCISTSNDPNTATGYLYIIDISTLTTPTIASTLTFSQSVVTSCYLSEKYVFISLLSLGETFRIYDVSNVASPTLVSNITMSNLNNVYIQNNLAFVSETINSVAVIDISNISLPNVIGSISTTNISSQNLIKGTYLMNLQDSELQIFDLASVYIQQMIAGGIDVNTLNIRDRFDLNGEADIRGGLTIGKSAFVNGDLALGGTFYNLSDSRKKREIKEIEGALEVLKRIEPVKYKWCKEVLNKNKTLTDQEYYGFIAQQLKTVIPEAVGVDKNGYFTVNYISLIPILTSALKQQDKRIEKLEKIVIHKI